MGISDTEGLETRADAEKVGGEAKYWQLQIELAEKDREDWLKLGNDVIARYKRDLPAGKSLSQAKSFNILYSNTEVLKGALFARVPKPDVRRRFADQDPMGRLVAEIVERSLVYVGDVGDTMTEIEGGIEDFLLPGRGILRVCYEATKGTADGKEYVAKQELWDEHVLWSDFLNEPAPSWNKVTWIDFKRKMSRDDLHANFDKALGEQEVNKIPLNWSPTVDKKTKVPEAFKKAEVHEIWDKSTRTRLWIVKGYDKVLRKDGDPLGLEEFWPMAKPIQATTTNDTFIPQPDFISYKDQADALDELESRIDRLTRALKRRGAYNANIEELKRIGKAADNEFIPVKKWDELRQGGGLKAVYEVEDIQPIASVLDQLHSQRDLRVQTIYEIIGISDIMRGSTNPNETLGAQQLKSQFGSNRLKRRQDAVQRWIRDTIRIKAEIIAEHFEPQKLAEITGFPWQPLAQKDPTTGQMVLPSNGSIDPQTGQPLPPQPLPEDTITPDVMNLLRTDRLRSYRIDVETDSTIYEDAEAEKTARTELLTAMTQFVAAWVPVLQVQPDLLPLAFELLAFGVRGFKTGRQVEEQLEQTKMKLEDAAKAAQAQPQQPPPIPPLDQAKIDQMKAMAQLEAQKHSDNMQLEQSKLQQSAQIEQAKLAQADQHKQLELNLSQQNAQQGAPVDPMAEMQAAKVQNDIALAQQKHADSMDLERAKMEHSAQIEQAKLDQADRHHEAKIKLERDRYSSTMKKPDGTTQSVEGVNPTEQMLETITKATEAQNEKITELLQTVAEKDAQMADSIAATVQALAAAIDKLSAPRQFQAIRDKSGRLSGGVTSPTLPSTIQ